MFNSKKHLQATQRTVTRHDANKKETGTATKNSTEIANTENLQRVPLEKRYIGLVKLVWKRTKHILGDRNYGVTKLNARKQPKGRQTGREESTQKRTQSPHAEVRLKKQQ